MTHHSPGHGAVPVLSYSLGSSLPVLLSGAGPPAPRLDRLAIDRSIAVRLACLADLELRLVAECEAAAAQGDPATSAHDDRQRWDRATWRRYLDAAARGEARYGPRMRRLRGDIAHLERLLDLPVAA